MNRQVVEAVLVASAMAGSFLGIGGSLLQVVGLIERTGSALRYSPIAAALGFAVFSYGAYALIATGQPGMLLVLLAIAAGIAAGYRYWPRLASDLEAALPTVRLLLAPLPLLFIAVVAGCLLVIAPNWLTPPREGDALYGYMFNARWIYAHGLTQSPYNTVYNLYPFNTEMVFSLAYAFRNDIIPKFLDGILGLALLGAVYECARRYASPLASFFAAASLLTMNAFTGVWGSGKVDLLCSLTLFSGLSVLLLAADRRSRRLLALSAFLVGTACAQKYTAWLFASAFVVAVPVVFGPRELPRRISNGLMAATIITVCLLPHFAKTISWTGNPIAPFGRGFIPSHNVYLNPSDFSDAAKISWANLPTLPVKLFADPSEPKGPGPFPLFLLIGVPLFLAARSRNTWRLAFIVASELTLWIVARQDQWLEPRFLIVPTGLLLVMAAIGFDRFAANRQLRWTVTAMMVALIAYAGMWQNRDWRRGWPFVFGRETRTAWNDRVAPARAYGTLQALAPRLGPNRRLFLTASLYYVPEEKLPFVSTEKEVAEFTALPESEQLAFLRERCFAYVHILGPISLNPSWTKSLEVAAQRDERGHGLEYSLFRLDHPCDDSHSE